MMTFSLTRKPQLKYDFFADAKTSTKIHRMTFSLSRKPQLKYRECVCVHAISAIDENNLYFIFFYKQEINFRDLLCILVEVFAIFSVF